jgi:hypothetical protein
VLARGGQFNPDALKCAFPTCKTNYARVVVKDAMAKVSMIADNKPFPDVKPAVKMNQTVVYKQFVDDSLSLEDDKNLAKSVFPHQKNYQEEVFESPILEKKKTWGSFHQQPVNNQQQWGQPVNNQQQWGIQQLNGMRQPVQPFTEMQRAPKESLFKEDVQMVN